MSVQVNRLQHCLFLVPLSFLSFSLSFFFFVVNWLLVMAKFSSIPLGEKEGMSVLLNGWDR